MHNMTENDSAVYYQKKAWHGLGTVTEDILNPREALKVAGLDWSVCPSTHLDYHYEDPDGVMQTGASSEKVANVRSDTNDVIGWVGKEYKIVQNTELAELAYSLAGDDTHVESFGSLRNGGRVYVCLRADSFFADRKHDEIRKYLLLANGHDGSLAFMGQPTSIRVVCDNTLKMALSEGVTSAFRFRHNGNMEDKMLQARQALAYFRNTGKFFEAKVTTLANTEWNHSTISKFWLECYSMITNKQIVHNPTTEAEENTLKDAAETVGSWGQTFDAERKELSTNPSAWMAANAVTNWIQHRVSKRGRKTTNSSRNDRNLFGKASKDSIRVIRKALSV